MYFLFFASSPLLFASNNNTMTDGKPRARDLPDLVPGVGLPHFNVIVIVLFVALSGMSFFSVAPFIYLAPLWVLGAVLLVAVNIVIPAAFAGAPATGKAD